MRHIAVLFLLLFATGMDKPEACAEQASFEKGSTQTNTGNTQHKPPEMRIAILAEDQPNTQTKEANAYNAAEDTLYRWYLRATIAGVAVALVGLSVLRKQNRNLASQIKIQSLALRQWIDTKHWKARIPDHERPTTMEIVVDIVNPTTA